MTRIPKRTQVRELIDSSRDRCAAANGLAQAASHPILRLQRAETTERRERFLELIGGFGPALDKAAVLPDKGRYCLLISDSERVVVEAYAPQGYEEEFDRFGIAVGSVWDERVAGTNGIDMALRNDRALTVHGPDHFLRCFHDFACSSSPLHDAQDNVIGTVTLVGSSRRRPEELAWCEQVLRVADNRFKAQLFRRFHSDRVTARLVSHDAERARRFETIVACDEDGTIRSSLPIWHDGAPPAAHRNLEGRHLSELRDVSVSLRGPAMVLPRRLVSISGAGRIAPPLRARAGAALARLAAHGGGMEVVVERARKLAAHRVPLLICGEPGVDKEGFARALREEVAPNSSASRTVDCARLACGRDLGDALDDLRFLSEYPIEKTPPVLVLLNADRLDGDGQRALKDFLTTFERDAQGAGEAALRPFMVFSAERGWRDLCESAVLDPSLLFLMGQAVLELPAVRDRDVARVLESVLRADFDDPPELSEAAREVLTRHDWPGNLREMSAVLREAAICGNGRRINLVDLPPRLLEDGPKPGGASRRQALIEALDSAGWNVTRAAALLGRSRATVNRWIEAEGLRRPQ